MSEATITKNIKDVKATGNNQKMPQRGNFWLNLRWVGLAVGLLAIGLWPQLVGNNNFWVTLWAQVAILMLLTSALNLALGYTDLVSVAHTALYLVGAYACGLLVAKLKLDFWLALPLAMLVAGLVGALMTLATLRVSHIYFAIVTLSFNLILVQLALAWDGLTNGEDGLVGLQRPRIGSQRLDLNQYGYIVWGLTLVSLWVIYNLVRSKFGRAFMAIRSDEATASALGIPPFKYKLISFVVSAALAGLAGALYAFLNGFVNPALGDNGGTVALSLFIALFVGGVGTQAGPILGAIFATALDRLLVTGGDWLNTVTNNPSNSAYQTLAYGILLLLTMAVLPGGIVGSWNKSRLGRLWQTQLASLQPLPEPRVDAVESKLDVQANSIQNQPQPPTSLLRVQGMSKSFGGLKALRGVDMEIKAGEIHGLIGPNGSGKSTFVNVISGQLPYDTGQIEFGGQIFKRPRAYQLAHHGLVRIFQAAHLFNNQTVLENMLAGFHDHTQENFIVAALHLPSQRATEKRLRQQAMDYLALVGLQDRARTLTGSLPHGQQRLLEIARALAVGPRLLILDEPATGLTAEELRGLSALLKALQRQGVTVLLIEHNMDFLMSLCDRVSVFEFGEKIAEGTPAQIQANPRVVAAYLGEPEADAVELNG